MGAAFKVYNGLGMDSLKLSTKRLWRLNSKSRVFLMSVKKS